MKKKLYKLSPLDCLIDIYLIYIYIDGVWKKSEYKSWRFKVPRAFQVPETGNNFVFVLKTYMVFELTLVPKKDFVLFTS